MAGPAGPAKSHPYAADLRGPRVNHMANLEGKKRLVAALEESRLIEREIIKADRRKDEGSAERFITQMTLPRPAKPAADEPDPAAA
jgi:hypothetical protein